MSFLEDQKQPYPSIKTIQMKIFFITGLSFSSISLRFTQTLKVPAMLDQAPQASFRVRE